MGCRAQELGVWGCRIFRVDGCRVSGFGFGASRTRILIPKWEIPGSILQKHSKAIISDELGFKRSGDHTPYNHKSTSTKVYRA